MATIDNDKAGGAGGTRAQAHINGRSDRLGGGTSVLTRDSLAALPRKLRVQMRENPLGVLAAVGAGSFLLGAVCGSKLGRIALAVAIPQLIHGAFEGPLRDRIRDLARDLASNLGGSTRQGNVAH